MQVDGVREAHVERGGQAEFFPDANAEDAAVDESDGVPCGGEIEDRRSSWIVHGVAVHGGEKAQAVEMAGGQGGLDAQEDVLSRRVHHRVGGEAIRELGGGGDHRIVVTGDAGDNSGAIDAMTVEFGGPLGGEGSGIVGHPPAKARRKRREGDLLLFRERSEKWP